MRQETNGAKIQKRLVVLLKMHVPSVDTYMQWDGQPGSLPSIRQLPESRCIYNLCNQHDLANRDIWPFGRLKCNGTVPRRKRNGRELELSGNSLNPRNRPYRTIHHSYL